MTKDNRKRRNKRKEETDNNRFDLSNPLARNLQEQQSKLRAKPFGHGFAGQANVRLTPSAQ
jgi:hypothetical protein